jgi:hypothetical protein
MRSFRVVQSSAYFQMDTGQALIGKKENAIESTARNTAPCSAPSGNAVWLPRAKRWCRAVRPHLVDFPVTDARSAWWS